jgi:lycopene beta-cyclase
MTSPSPWNILIAGGGLAGLAMALELAQPQFAHLKVLLVEQRSQYVRDRTWSYWAPANAAVHPYQHLERATWAQWRVAQAGTSLVCGGGGQHSYRSLDADAFYNHALTTLGACPHISVRLGCAVQSISADGVQATVQLQNHESPLHANLVFDARTPDLHLQTAQPQHLAQHFVGWEIETELPLFDPHTVDLMDFVPCTTGLHFFYVLPYSPHRALVEATWVSPAHLHQNHVERLQRYINQRFGSPVYQCLYEERGSLPLQRPTQQVGAPSNLIKLGRAAGTLRASTGFAFLDTLADCHRLAHELGTDQPLTAFKRCTADASMDSLFLHVLASHWQAAPDLFMALFQRTPTDRLMRFLSGQASVLDRACVVASLPKSPFLASLKHMLARPIKARLS